MPATIGILASAYQIPASAYEPESETLFAAMTTAPNDTRKGHINTLIAGLKTDGLWSALSKLWVMAAHDAQSGRLNWIAPASDALTLFNSPTFTTDRGYTGSTSNYLNGPIPPFTSSAGHLGLWSLTAGSLSNSGDSGNTNSVIAARTALEFSHRTAAASTMSVSNSDGSGHFVSSRTSASVCQGYRNGATLGGSSLTGATPSGDTLAICGRRSSGSVTISTRQLSIVHVGSTGLSGAQVTALYNRFLTYMTAIGAV